MVGRSKGTVYGNRTLPGQTIYTRISPRALQTCLQIVEDHGMFVHGMSLSMAVRRAIEAMTDLLIRNEVVAEPDPFRYQEMVSRYALTTMEARQMKMNVHFSDRNIRAQAAIQDALMPGQGALRGAIQPPPPMPGLAQLPQGLREMIARSLADPLNPADPKEMWKAAGDDYDTYLAANTLVQEAILEPGRTEAEREALRALNEKMFEVILAR